MSQSICLFQSHPVRFYEMATVFCFIFFHIFLKEGISCSICLYSLTDHRNAIFLKHAKMPVDFCLIDR